jgi:hypothetical protein
MEETDVCYPTAAVRFLQQAIPNGCPAKALPPSQRLTMSVQALAGSTSITALAAEFSVSRKFVYQQATTAQAALEEAFTSTAADDQVLFWLPVTKAWLQQAMLGLTLMCHASYGNVVEFFRDLLDVHTSVGTVHNVLNAVIDKARIHNQNQDLANIKIAGLDEIFQCGQPVLTGMDMASSYCFLLSAQDQRDADTWGVCLLEAADHGFCPEATIADFGAGIRAGQRLALPGVRCRGDIFHGLSELVLVATFLENRAYDALAAHDKLQHKKAQYRRQGRSVQPLARRAMLAKQAQDQAIALADDVGLLTRWLRYDVFGVTGLPYPDRRDLFDFIVEQLQARIPLCPHKLTPVCTLLQNHRDDLLAFACQLDEDLIQLAAAFAVPVQPVRALLDLQSIDQHRSAHWQQAAALHRQLGHRYHALEQAVQALADQVVRASSLVENLNSRLRNYFFLRRHIGPDYLALLQFFLNHRRFLRSEYAERVDRSPAELLTGQRHRHWLEMLGYQRFSRN